jgi:homocysteine S-methyltransferase
MSTTPQTNDQTDKGRVGDGWKETMRQVKERVTSQGVLILDGGLATELENRGCDLHHRLWSAKLLAENPGLIREVHGEYLSLSRVDLLTTSSYQASTSGFLLSGYSTQEAQRLLKLSIRLALDAVVAFEEEEEGENKRKKDGGFACRLPLVMVSLGSYGATLADGSEYNGKYAEKVGLKKLKRFQRNRLFSLLSGITDPTERTRLVLLFETIPSVLEAKAIFDLLAGDYEEEEEDEGEGEDDKEGSGGIEKDERKEWWLEELPFGVSLSYRSEEEVSDGTKVEMAMETLVNGVLKRNDESLEQRFLGLGLNCTDPSYVHSLLFKINSSPALIRLRTRNSTSFSSSSSSSSSTDVGEVVGGEYDSFPLTLCYPNLGKGFDATTHTWLPVKTGMMENTFSQLSLQWYKAGARILGGCCRTTPLVSSSF